MQIISFLFQITLIYFVVFIYVFVHFVSDLKEFDILRLPRDPNGKILFPKVPKIGGTTTTTTTAV